MDHPNTIDGLRFSAPVRFVSPFIASPRRRRLSASAAPPGTSWMMGAASCQDGFQTQEPPDALRSAFCGGADLDDPLRCGLYT
jgi:hypothetical protein